MTKERRTIEDSLSELKKPKMIDMRISILVAVLTFLLGIWIGFFAFSFVNTYFNHNKNNKTVISQEKKTAASQNKETIGPKIVIVGSSKQTAAETSTPAETSSPSNKIIPEQKTVPLSEKTTAAETVNQPAVAAAKSKHAITKRSSTKSIRKEKIKNWAIQIGSYRNKSSAIRMLKKIASKSMVAHIRKISNKKGVFYRVIINFKGTKTKLNRIAKKIENSFHIKPFIYDPIS
ncbi:MAG: hypothetical protein GXP60_01625 [Epsilonproteobacteria bacterium]|nr:hypothetical protein [Campylobacterota bacterium]